MTKLNQVILRGVAASRPAAGSMGRLYWSTDTEVLERDNGAGWDAYSLTQGSTWVLIEETILGGAVASVTFSAIPGTYRTLALDAHARTSRVNESDSINWRVNGDSGANYDYSTNQIFNSGVGTADARAQTSARFSVVEGSTARANCFAPVLAYWPGYALTSQEKYCKSFGNVVLDMNLDQDVRTSSSTGHWRSTAAITSLIILPNTGPNLASGSRFTLYGIL
jgi:hypothetical protein